ncbi:MAG TPA: filamentous hemagglutinin family protein [Nitrospirota bacterium]|nr:filamentous hemagglutinin family protein [Nitrospirota bacterium]
MKTGIVQTLLHLLCCVLILFPHYALAGSVNIPGFAGSVPVRATAPAFATTQAQSTRVLAIPGFYNGAAVPVIPANEVPVALPGGSRTGLDSSKGDQGIATTSGQVNVYQNQQNAIIDWQSFNIGSDASVRFYQGQGTPETANWKPNSSYAALNRIWDLNPSQIFGTLTADGRIYLINQNGILFGSGSKQVNVNSLVASALNIHDNDFLNNVFHFKLENYQNPGLAPNPLATVSNIGEINAASGGSVFLIGPRVENSGTINAPTGQIGLVAATDVTLVPPGSNDLSRSGYYVIVDPSDFNDPNSDPTFGKAVNQEGAHLNADGGMVGMYGNNIDQWGVIRAVTAFQNKQGQVELRAANKITTGANSSIDLHVYGMDSNTEQVQTVDDTFNIQPIVDIKGLQALGVDTIVEGSPAKQIALQGKILAPTGRVTISATDRTDLASGSSIDVSGVVANLPMPMLSDVKLTSVELRDYYAQQDGVLQGAKISTPVIEGSSIGDLSQAILTRERTALERSIGGAMTKNSDGSYTPQNGQVNVTASNGDIVMNQGAIIDISGGAVNYAGGLVNSTKLLSGMKVYDISNAPANIHYDKVLNGKSYVMGYTQGGDAGALTFNASRVVMDGQLKGGVTRGYYQNAWTSGTGDAMALSKARGLEAPRAGTLTINNASSITVAADSQPQAGVASSDTVLSAKILNAANLATLDLNANLAFTTETGAVLVLQPGGTFSAQAGRIDHEGSIEAAAGTIDLSIIGSVPDNQRIVIGSQSSLDASGERIDSSRTVNKSAYSNLGLLNGGSISIKDKTENGDGVFIASGAVVNVSGGTLIDQKGKVTGGNAGQLSVQGVNIMLNGNLRGYALADANGQIAGGSITLTSKDIRVGQTGDVWNPDFDPEISAVPDAMKGKLNLAASLFDDTGFTQITLNSINNIILDKDTVISPSLVRLKNPLQGQTGSATGKPLAGHPDLVRLDDSYSFMAGPSSFSAAAAAVNFPFDGSDVNSQGNLTPVDPSRSDAKIIVSPGAVIRTTPNAKSLISLNAANYIDMAGILYSPGGKVTLNSQNSDLTIRDGAKIIVSGYNRPDSASTPKGYNTNYLPVSAGSVVLGAAGSLDMEVGSLIDISGSPEVENRMLTVDGKIVTFPEAGDPGSLSLSFGNSLAWNGTVNVSRADGNIKGGTLAIKRTDANNGLEVRAQDVEQYRDLGFDDLTLASRNSLLFQDSMNVSLGRKLTLDAPQIVQKSGQDVILKAPWIVLTNKSAQPSDLSGPVSGAGSLTLDGQWIDVIGSTQLIGFTDVMLSAARDIRLSEALYNNAINGNLSSGKLAATGNLILDADRVYPGNFYSYKDGSNVIYPEIYSDFTVHADGTVTIQNSHTPVGGPIYSAGGSLAVEGIGGIDVEKGGTLAAPLGTITLTTASNGNAPAAGSRIYLADGSVLMTAGNTEVEYGDIDPGNIWVTEDKTNPGDLVFNSKNFSSDSLPQQVTLNADTTVAMKGSVIDVSGGGSVFAYKFQPGVEGSVDPLTKPNRYVAIRSDAFALPGQAVYLQGAGLSAGMYTLLPLDPGNPQNARYAFMPGAYIIEAQSGAVLPGTGSMSKDGYPLAIGYRGVADTSILGTRPQVYSVRTAEDVLAAEGNYVRQSLIAGDGGNISIKGSTIVLDGTLKGSALPGYQGGRISLSGQNIFVQSSGASQLAAAFGFGDAIDPGLQNKLTISGDTVKGFQEVDLGDVAGTSATNSITVKAGTELDADVISLGAAGAGANSSIAIENGARLAATTGSGEIDLATPGSLLVDADAMVHASRLISLDLNDVQGLRGNLQSDNGAIRLKSNAIFFGNGVKGQSDVGLYLTAGDVGRFTGFSDLTFASRSNIQFKDNFTLSAPGSLTLDAARILDMNTNGPSAVTLNSAVVNLKNTDAASPTTSSTAGTFTVNASDQINIGGGSVQFGGFQTINLNAANDLALKGQGSLKTGNADLNVTAARVITASDSSGTKKYIAPNFIIDIGTGVGRFNSSGSTPSASAAPGGMLEIDARRFELATVLQSDGGTINLSTRGAAGFADDGIILHSGGRILAKGTDDAPGGSVNLATDYVDALGIAQSGTINLEAGSLIDVSAGYQGDAGLISLRAPKGGVTLDGDIAGAAQDVTDTQGNIVRKGTGGSFSLDTDRIGDFTGLSAKLKSGGFSENIDLRARTNDVTIDSNISAHRLRLTADAGTIDVNANVTADGSGGSQVELHAMNDVNIGSNGSIRAVSESSNSRDPNVLLSSSQGSINVNGTIDVSDGSSNASGVVYLRAQRNNTNDDMNVAVGLQGSIKGASAVYAEAVKSYDISSSTPDQILPAAISDATSFYSNNQTVSRLGPVINNFHLLPGIEMDSTGDINWSAAWDATASRFGTAGEPGVLTLRASGNLNVSQNLTDHPTDRSGLVKSNARESHDSWGLNLVAGADSTSADYLAVIKGKTDSAGYPAGNLMIADGTVVYTESAPVNFASGNDTVIGSGGAPGFMINTTIAYNLGSYDGAVHGNVGRDLIINGGAVQTAIGDIDIQTGRDVQLNADMNNYLGAIRTTGRLSSTAAFGQDSLDPVAPVYVDPVTGKHLTLTAPQGVSISNFYWRYVDGGNITLDAGGAVGEKSGNSEQLITAMSIGQWDYFSKVRACLSGTGACGSIGSFTYGQFSANYSGQTVQATAGLAAMGGGAVSVRTGGDFLAQAGTFGAGDLTIYSGGDIKGRFLNRDGQGNIHATGNFGAFDPAGVNERVQIELFNSQTAISALGDIQIGAIVNPDLANSNIQDFRFDFVKCSYTPDTSIGLKAGGDVTLAGKSPFYSNTGNNGTLTESVLPATVNINAGGNVSLLNNFTLTSSPDGNLRLFAGGDIRGSYNNLSPVMMMSDIAPDYWYGLFYVRGTSETEGGTWRWITSRVSDNAGNYENLHGFYKPADADKQALASPLHSGDTQSIDIKAGGDISDMIFYFPKKAEVTAGRDITDIIYEGQNIDPSDVSTIKAGRDISMQYVKGAGTPTSNSNEAVHEGLIQGGPGVFTVQAGGSIDLGTLQDGIQAIGNGNNSMLSTGNSSLIILSGYGFDKSATDIDAFFTAIRTAGDKYAELFAKGQQADAAQLLKTTRDDTINPFLGDPTGVGDINMTSSQIATSIGKSDIFVIANGDLNLGKTSLPVPGSVTKPTGITTGGGGAINIFTRKDINVQESRTMTFFSRQDVVDPAIAYGDITVWSDQGSINAGRGSRTAVSASPPKRIKTSSGNYITVFTPPAVGSGIRAATYGDNPPTPGNIHLFAPSGIIDAGEAGIAGGRVTLAALQVNNAANINFSLGSVGMPQASQGATSLGTLAGSASTAQTSQMAADASGLSATKVQGAQMVDDIIAKWLEVKVIDFVGDDSSNDNNNREQ